MHITDIGTSGVEKVESGRLPSSIAGLTSMADYTDAGPVVAVKASLAIGSRNSTSVVDGWASHHDLSWFLFLPDAPDKSLEGIEVERA